MAPKAKGGKPPAPAQGFATNFSMPSRVQDRGAPRMRAGLKAQFLDCNAITLWPNGCWLVASGVSVPVADHATNAKVHFSPNVDAPRVASLTGKQVFNADTMAKVITSIINGFLGGTFTADGVKVKVIDIVSNATSVKDVKYDVLGAGGAVLDTRKITARAGGASMMGRAREGDSQMTWRPAPQDTVMAQTTVMEPCVRGNNCNMTRPGRQVRIIPKGYVCRGCGGKGGEWCLCDNEPEIDAIARPMDVARENELPVVADKDCLLVRRGHRKRGGRRTRMLR